MKDLLLSSVILFFIIIGNAFGIAFQSLIYGFKGGMNKVIKRGEEIAEKYSHE